MGPAYTAPSPPPLPPPSLQNFSGNKIKLKLTRNLAPIVTKVTETPVVIVNPPTENLTGNDHSSGSDSSDSDTESQTNLRSPSIQSKIDWFDPPSSITRKRS